MSTTTDIGQEYDVIPERSVLALGITDDDTDEEISDVLETYGSVSKIIRLKPTRAIIEFDLEEVVTHLRPQFPCEVATARDPTVKWVLDSLDKMVPLRSKPSSSVTAAPSKAAPETVGSIESGSSDSGEAESDSSETSPRSKGPKHNSPTTAQYASMSSSKSTKPKKELYQSLQQH